MNNPKEMLSGVFTPMCTPFINDEVSYEGVKKNILRMNKSGLKGYFVLGTNGEFKTLSEDESIRILEIVLENSGSEKIIMAGTGCESTRETIRMTKQVASMGVPLVSILMPSFFAKKIDSDVLINHIIEVADASPVPVVLYNNPSVTAGITIGTDVIEVICKHKNVAGIKDSSKETWFDNVVYDSDDFSVLAGSAGYFFDLMEKGGTGGVLSLANVFPDACAKLYKLYKAGDVEKAVKLKDDILKLNKNISGKYGVAGVKYAMDIAGFTGGHPRRPLKSITVEQKKSLEFDIGESGLLR